MIANEKKLEAVQEAFQSGKKLEKKTANFIYDLSSSKYQPALSFFLSLLDEGKYDWRLEGVTALIYYDLSSKQLEKIRWTLLHDSKPSVRTFAANILGLRSKWPDPALREAIEKDQARSVRISAVEAVLFLADVPAPIVSQETKRMANGEIEPDLSAIERITQQVSDSRNNR